MRFILVVDRRHLFPGLSPQGLLPPGAVDVEAVERLAFFAERDYMERCSHFKQLIPYMVLIHHDQVLCYQRHAAHTESRLGGLWTIGFGGHIEPIDRGAPDVAQAGLLQTAALRELAEETGFSVLPKDLCVAGFLNSEREEVSSVHFGVLFLVDLSRVSLTREQIAASVLAQAEPFHVAWRARTELARADLAEPAAPEGGRWEDWTRLALPALARSA
jgi:predicted NUDIX family phosphoesterase